MILLWSLITRNYSLVVHLQAYFAILCACLAFLAFWVFIKHISGCSLRCCGDDTLCIATSSVLIISRMISSFSEQCRLYLQYVWDEDAYKPVRLANVGSEFCLAPRDLSCSGQPARTLPDRHFAFPVVFLGRHQLLCTLYNPVAIYRPGQTRN